MNCSHTGIPIPFCAHCQGKPFPDAPEEPSHGFRQDKPIFQSLGTSSHRLRDAAQGTRNARWRHHSLGFESHSQIRILAGLIAGRLDEKEKEDERKKPKTLPSHKA